MTTVDRVKKREEPVAPAVTLKPKPAKWLTYSVVAVAGIVAGLVLAELIYKVGLLIKRSWSNDNEKPEGNFRELFKPLVQTVAKFTSVAPSGVYNKLPLTTQDEQKVIHYLQDNYELSVDQLQEILKGAHVYLDDAGKAYQHWKVQLQSINQRVSSHPSSAPQYALRGPLVKEMLFSQLDQYTWFQLENNPMVFGCVTDHMVDYLRYKITGYNQGPFGSSLYRHNNPLILKPKKTVAILTTESHQSWQAS